MEGVYDATGSRKIETAITANLRAIDSAMSSSLRELGLLRETLSSDSGIVRELQKTAANQQATPGPTRFRAVSNLPVIEPDD